MTEAQQLEALRAFARALFEDWPDSLGVERVAAGWVPFGLTVSE